MQQLVALCVNLPAFFSVEILNIKGKIEAHVEKGLGETIFGNYGGNHARI